MQAQALSIYFRCESENCYTFLQVFIATLLTAVGHFKNLKDDWLDFENMLLNFC